MGRQGRLLVVQRAAAVGAAIALVLALYVLAGTARGVAFVAAGLVLGALFLTELALWTRRLLADGHRRQQGHAPGAD